MSSRQFESEIMLKAIQPVEGKKGEPIIEEQGESLLLRTTSLSKTFGEGLCFHHINYYAFSFTLSRIKKNEMLF